MPTTQSPFSYRMMHAIAPELIDYAARMKLNSVVVASSGHKGGSIKDDPPVFFGQYEKYQPIRTPLRARIQGERQRVRALIGKAHRAGMKAIYHSYEPSMPYDFVKAYPQYYSKPVKEYAQAAPDAPEVRNAREMCIARPEVQEAISAKVEEICRAFPDLDGYMYTNNESSSGTKVWHRCDHCRDIPYPQTMKMLHDAMAEGIRRSGRPVRLFYRFWGANDTDEHYWQSNQWRVDFGVSEIPAKSWMRAWVEAHKPAHMHFVPSRDIPRFVKLIKGTDTVFVYKATWADTNLHHPLNPMLGKYADHEQVCELSFEHCSSAPRSFYVMGRELQRRARLCRDKGVDGLCVVPIHWGENELIPTAYTPSNWSLGDLNMDLFKAVVENPDADLEKATSAYLKRRYGKSLPAELSRMLLDTEDIAHGSATIGGIRATGRGLENFYYELIRYAPMFPGWRKKVFPSKANLEAIWKDKQRNIERAEAMVQRIDALKDKLPPQAYEELRLCFSHLLHNARGAQATHRYSMTLWALKEGTIKPTTVALEQLHSYVQDMLRQGPQRSANTLHRV